ncbi:MAG: BrnT family toxin [Alphaproteobacteria bacterium]|nr:BrnT family toxin [Alphaproteobacteria bacterium]
MDKEIEWNEEKSELLRNKYGRKGVDFEECAVLIKAEKFLDVINNPSPKRPHQRMFVLEIRNYVYIVPFVETDDKVFLKTIYPSRKYTATYLRKEKQ